MLFLMTCLHSYSDLFLAIAYVMKIPIICCLSLSICICIEANSQHCIAVIAFPRSRDHWHRIFNSGVLFYFIAKAEPDLVPVVKLKRR